MINTVELGQNRGDRCFILIDSYRIVGIIDYRIVNILGCCIIGYCIVDCCMLIDHIDRIDRNYQHECFGICSHKSDLFNSFEPID